ncbi:hypothetical protein JHK85_044203 [Glycine max]|nr:hypothetical protein JHK85_044203 [Glycine max]
MRPVMTSGRSLILSGPSQLQQANISNAISHSTNSYSNPSKFFHLSSKHPSFKITFLFLTNTDLYFFALWDQFFSSTPSNLFHIYIHIDHFINITHPPLFLKTNTSPPNAPSPPPQPLSLPYASSLLSHSSKTLPTPTLPSFPIIISLSTPSNTSTTASSYYAASLLTLTIYKHLRWYLRWRLLQKYKRPPGIAILDEETYETTQKLNVELMAEGDKEMTLEEPMVFNNLGPMAKENIANFQQLNLVQNTNKLYKNVSHNMWSKTSQTISLSHGRSYTTLTTNAYDTEHPMLMMRELIEFMAYQRTVHFMFILILFIIRCFCGGRTSEELNPWKTL